MKKNTNCIVVTREIKHGEPVYGTAKMYEYHNAGAAIRGLEDTGFVVSGTDPNTFFLVDNYRMVEARLIW